MQNEITLKVTREELGAIFAGLLLGVQATKTYWAPEHDSRPLIRQTMEKVLLAGQGAR